MNAAKEWGVVESKEMNQQLPPRGRALYGALLRALGEKKWGDSVKSAGERDLGEASWGDGG